MPHKILYITIYCIRTLNISYDFNTYYTDSLFSDPTTRYAVDQTAVARATVMNVVLFVNLSSIHFVRIVLNNRCKKFLQIKLFIN